MRVRYRLVLGVVAYRVLGFSTMFMVMVLVSMVT